jgi:hypothetical protein
VKKYLALFLIAIMAVSVLSAAGVVTAQNAAAQSMPVKKVAVAPIPTGPLYSPGATYIYTPNQFNWFVEEWLSINSAPVSNIISGGSAFASTNTTTAVQAGSYSRAGVGMWWPQLSLPSTGQYSTWAAVKNMPCTVIVTAYYVIQARGNQNAYADAYWGPWLGSSSTPWIQGSPYSQASVVAGHIINVKVGVTFNTWHGTVGALFQNEGSGFAGVGVDSGGGPGHASGKIVCTSIVLAFPK